MQSNNPFMDDLSKMASGAVGALNSARQEVEQMVKSRVEKLAGDMDLVPREDFDVLKAIAIENRRTIEKLEAEVKSLRAELQAAGSPKTTRKKPATKSAKAKKK